MIKRNDYKKREETIFTRANENPRLNTKLADYPDMYGIYEEFNKKFMDNNDSFSFILTNGCENALRITCQVVKRLINGKVSLYKESPTWGMVPVIYDQVFYDCTSINSDLEFMYDDKLKGFVYSTTSVFDKDSNNILYRTYRTNNLFSHQDLWFSNTWQIVDYTYTLPLNAIKEYKQSLLDHYNDKDVFNFIGIGSFSKFYGCGLRLGYILFNNKLKDVFNLYREEYINRLACDFILKYKPLSGEELTLNSNIYEYGINIDSNVISKNLNYRTIKSKDAIDNHYNGTNKEFTVKDTNGKDISFYRLGYHKL